MTAVSEITAKLASVPLTELVREAALLKRVDRKYLVPSGVAAALLQSLSPDTRVLEVDGVREFAYDSVYFDTDDYRVYKMSATGRRRRFKVRTRTYLDTGGCYLEVKTKDGRGATVKNRIDYSETDRAQLTPQGRRFVASTLAGHGGTDRTLQSLEAKLVSRYHRTTLLLPGGSRATLDAGVYWCDFFGSDAALIDYFVIESKSAQRASELDLAMREAGYRPFSISKFGVGMAALKPALSHNKWERALRRVTRQEQNSISDSQVGTFSWTRNSDYSAV